MPTPISKKEISTYVLAGGFFALALAISYFAFVLVEVKNALPEIVDGIKEAEDKFQPILDEVAEIRMLVPGIVNEVEQVRLTIPPIVKEVENIRGEIPVILAEVGEIRKQIPEITKDVEAIVAQIPPILKEVEALRTQTIPPILEEVAALRTQTIPPILDEVAAIRTTTIPPILDQVESIHGDIPGYFDRADRIVAEAKTAGQEASEGAVKGVFTGIIKAPMSLVSGLGGAMGGKIEATPEDTEIALQAAAIVFQSDKKGTSQSFENPETDLSGTITLRSIRKVDGRTHKTVRLVASKKGKKLAEVDIEAAAREDGTWEHIKTTER